MNDNKTKKIIRLLIVDDSSLFRETLGAVVQRHTGFQVVGMATDGEKAMKLVVEQQPDLIILDLEMPHMDGFTFLRWLMVYFPTPVLVVSSRSDGYSVFKALELGASDFLEKPSNPQALLESPQELLVKIDILSKIPRKIISRRYSELIQSQSRRDIPASPVSQRRGVSHVLAIGASTGGPPALYEIVTRLPDNIPAAVVISQHMPAGFTKSFAERLNKASHLPVLEVVGGEPLEDGRVYIAPGGYHLLFDRAGSRVITVLKSKSEEDRCIPSIDQMMASAAQIFGPRVFGIILTGMGSDGKIGMKKIKEKGGKTLAESEETAVVYGMPRESIEAGVADKALPLHQIAREILKHYKITK